MPSGAGSVPKRAAPMRVRVPILTALLSLACLACNDLRVDFPPSVHSHWWTGFDANGMTNQVLALTEYNGSLVAGGLFLRAGDVDAFGIARWTGDGWAPLARGVRRHDCTTISCTASAAAFTEWNGALVVGGRFTIAGGEPSMSIAVWDGTLWHSLGAGFNADVLAVASYNGRLVAGGNFTMSGSTAVSHLAIWDGVTWQALGGGVDGNVRQLVAYGADLIVAGDFAVAGQRQINRLARWDGTDWTALGSLAATRVGDFVNALLVRDGILFVAGQVPVITADDQDHIVSVARWDGQKLRPLGEQFFNYATALCSEPGGLVVATAGGLLFRWDGVSWTPLGSALSAQVFALHSIDGSVFVGGAFDHAGDRPSHYIARWDPNVE
jgi:hypothetical protein